MKIALQLKSKRMVVGAIFSVAAFLLCYAFSGSALKCSVLSVAIIISASLRVEVSHKFFPFTLGAFTLISAFAALFLSQFSLGEGIANLEIRCIVFGIIACAFLFSICFILWPNVRFAGTISTVIPLILATINFYVYAHRGSTFMPMDIFAFETTINVIGSFQFSLNANIVYAWVLWALFSFSLFSLYVENVKHRSALYASTILSTVILISMFSFGTTNISVRHFRNDGTYYNGYFLNFLLAIKECFPAEPHGYSQTAVDKIAAPYIKEATSSIPSDYPDIIVIMNESFSDLSVLGENFHPSENPAPFLSNLKENTIRGYALTSAFGARTANSEYEFLAGGSMAFSPEGAIAYQQFVSDDSYTLVSTLDRLGYTTLAMHPFHANGWMRDTVWPALGFDMTLFLDDFPAEADLLRNYVSDAEMYQQVIAQYEARDKHRPFFLFGVTMQNHSPFDYSGDNFTNHISLEGYSQNYPLAEQYLSLVYESDKAIETLIAYFSQVDRETIIVFYGDHLPALETEFYEEIHGGPFTTLDEQLLQYKIPFFVWTNYDIAEQTIDCTGLNYVSTIVYETAGITLPAYNLFLKDLQAAIPSMNAYGYYSLSQGKYLPFSDKEGAEKEWLDKYHILQYQYMFEHPDPRFYGVWSICE